MTGGCRFLAALALAAWLWPFTALHAQGPRTAPELAAEAPADDASADPGQLPLPGTPRNLEPDLYLEAMQAIAEGRKNDASSTLSRMLAHGPRHAGEWLDLALLQCALGHADEAERLFRHIEDRFAPPQGIRDIIARQRSQGCASWQRQQLWTLTAGRGYDQNVNQGASNPFYTIGGGADGQLTLDPAYRPQADRYGLVSADYLVDLNQNGDLGFAQLYARHNDTLASYNTISLFAGVDHPWRWQRWGMRASGLVGALSLGGRLYQAQGQLQLRVVPPLTLPANLEWSVMGSFSHLNYRTLTNFDANTTELRNILAYRTDTRQLQASLGAQNDHAVSTRPGGNRTGWNANLYGRSMLGDKFEAELDYTFQHWRGSTAYSPGFIDTVRHQDSHTLRAMLSYPLTATTALQLEWRQVNNKENISIFQYDNHVLQLSWRWRDGR